MFRHIALYDRVALAVAAGLISNLIINVPPQTGKSQYWSRLVPAWFIGTFPEKRIILASYEYGAASAWGRRTRDLLEEHGEEIFGIKVRQDTRAVNNWEIEGHQGSMSTAGFGGPISGKSADLLIVDDPHKSAEEASSTVIKDRIWEEWDASLSTRVQQGGARIIISTRWATDDLTGRVLKRAAETGEKWTLIKLPAIATQDEDWPEWEWSRKAGESLCPELYSAETYAERQRNLGDYTWSTLYQQEPYIRTGGMFDVSRWIRGECRVPVRPAIATRVRGWDFAATVKETSKRTAGVRMSKDQQGRYYIEHVSLGKYRTDERNAVVERVVTADKCRSLFEQEGGSGGEDQASFVGKMLAGSTFEFIKPTGDKVVRADPFSAQVNAGNVYLVDDGTWNVEAYIEELAAFPSGQYSDQVDASGMAFNWLSPRKVENAAPRAENARPTRPPGDEDWRSGFVRMNPSGDSASDWRARFV
jgi:predicted phage terminase large subunit-like protein